MSSTRFFVANLPPNVTEKQLNEVFQDYGLVERVELKTKENAFEPENVKVLAFVTLQIHPNDVNNCVDALNWVKVQGAKIKVSVAKESFLERLKRERKEAEKGKTADTKVTWNEEQTEAVLPRSVQNTRKKFTEEDLTALENDDEIAADLLISKKRAATSLYNGKIVIQNYDTAPLHIIEGVKKRKKKPDGTETISEQKRKESQNKMTKQYKEKKSVIQQALSGMDAPKSNKIKFSDAEEEDESTIPNDSKHKSKTNIFGSDEDDNEAGEQLQLKPELFGKKGAKLIELQSKQSLDPRFRIDAKFVEDDEEDQQQSDTGARTNNEASGEVNERSWQMGILEQVVGTKIDVTDNAQKAARKKRMLRYDPSKEEHQKLLRTSNKETQPAPDAEAQTTAGKKKQKKKQAESEETTVADAGPEVSKEIFYVVTDTLAESLKTRGDGFSLLNMFGSAEVQDKRADELKKVSDAKILVNKLDKNALNPFKYDSSSDEGEKEPPKQTATDGGAQKKSKQQNKILLESFFIPRNDARLKEGAKFFHHEKKDAPEEDYEAVRNRLKLLIRSKINKTKKNLVANSGVGGVGRKRRIKGLH
ncbi:PREDICTED: probable RNA-binding protein CG14230 [Bactrocera latifrons]|uniref:Putative RNA-binding protein CG14230 n=1 Tax=Bactrocera latifrons TaxID=174628 RepID=A0A0K8W9J4_BACLA|nr:PREDICTED: probable RNA-binding protein CG14230 [Bactrocera latifrons]